MAVKHAISIASSAPSVTEMRSRGASGSCLVCFETQAIFFILGNCKKYAQHNVNITPICLLMDPDQTRFGLFFNPFLTVQQMNKKQDSRCDFGEGQAAPYSSLSVALLPNESMHGSLLSAQAGHPGHMRNPWSERKHHLCHYIEGIYAAKRISKEMHDLWELVRPHNRQCLIPHRCKLWHRRFAFVSV